LDMLAARPAATTTPRPAANVGVTISRRNAGPSRRQPAGRGWAAAANPARDCRYRDHLNRARGLLAAACPSGGPLAPASPAGGSPAGDPSGSAAGTRAAPDRARCRGAALLPGDRIWGFYTNAVSGLTKVTEL
jgi:hypothetical protein